MRSGRRSDFCGGGTPRLCYVASDAQRPGSWRLVAEARAESPIRREGGESCLPASDVAQASGLHRSGEAGRDACATKIEIPPGDALVAAVYLSRQSLATADDRRFCRAGSPNPAVKPLRSIAVVINRRCNTPAESSGELRVQDVPLNVGQRACSRGRSESEQARCPPQTAAGRERPGGGQAARSPCSMDSQSARTRKSPRSRFSAASRNWRTRSFETPSSAAISSSVASSR